jgi:hypothetical protein
VCVQVCVRVRACVWLCPLKKTSLKKNTSCLATTPPAPCILRTAPCTRVEGHMEEEEREKEREKEKVVVVEVVADLRVPRLIVTRDSCVCVCVCVCVRACV